MTSKDYKKVFKQLVNKPAKLKKFLKHNAPKKRNFGVGSRKCKRCGRYGAHIQKYNLNLCRHCFREIAKNIGFKKYNWGKKMALNDPLSNALSHILNCERLGKSECYIKINSKLVRNVLDILRKEGYVGDYTVIPNGKSGILKLNLLGNINNCNVIKPRFPVSLIKIEKYEKRYLPAKDFGILIISTSKGLMIQKDMIKHKIGGKLIAYCY